MVWASVSPSAGVIGASRYTKATGQWSSPTTVATAESGRFVANVALAVQPLALEVVHEDNCLSHMARAIADRVEPGNDANVSGP